MRPPAHRARRVRSAGRQAPTPAPAPAIEFSYAQAPQDLPLHTPPEPVVELSYAQATEDLPLHTPPEPDHVPAPDDLAAVADPPVADIWAALAAPAPMDQMLTVDIAAREKAVRTIAALEQWLEAIHVARAHRHA